MEYLNQIRENGLFDFILITAVSKSSLFPKDFIYGSLIILMRYLCEIHFKKIYNIINKECVLILIQFLNYFNIIDIKGKGFVLFFILVYIYVEKLLVKMKLGTLLVVTNFIVNEISYQGQYLSNDFPTGNAVEFFMIHSLYFLNTISLIENQKQNKFNYLMIILGFLPLYIIIKNFFYLWDHFVQCLYFFFGTKTLYFFFYWSFILFCFSYINNGFQKLDLRQTVKRKIYHFLAFIILVPGIKYLDKSILKLILMIVSYLFVVFEFIRNFKFIKDFSLVKNINSFMIENIDYRDDDKFIVTHIFLMTGLISSLYYDNQGNDTFNYLSIIVLGIGDAMSAICGVYFGKTRIYALNARTLEGSFGGLSSSLISYYYFNGSINMDELIKFIIIFFYEGYTLEVDNLFLPLLSNNLFLNWDLIKQKILKLFN
jgi:dolichol kinase